MRQRIERLAGTLQVESEPGPAPRSPRPLRPWQRGRMHRSAADVVDDHPVVRDGLSGMFAGDPDFEVVGEAGDGARGGRAVAERCGPT